MMPAKNGVNEFAAIMRNITRFFYVDGRVKIIVHFDQPAFIQFGGVSSELPAIKFWIADHGRHSSNNCFIGPEEIKKRNKDKQNEPEQETNGHEKNLPIGKEFLVLCETYCMEQIKYKEHQWDDGIVDTIFKKWISSCG